MCTNAAEPYWHRICCLRLNCNAFSYLEIRNKTTAFCSGGAKGLLPPPPLWPPLTCISAIINSFSLSLHSLALYYSIYIYLSLYLPINQYIYLSGRNLAPKQDFLNSFRKRLISEIYWKIPIRWFVGNRLNSEFGIPRKKRI